MGGTSHQVHVRELPRVPEDFDQEKVATVWEESVEADTDAEGTEEEIFDIWGRVHAAGASPGAGEQDGTGRHGQDLPSSVAGVDNNLVDKLTLIYSIK